MSDQIATTEVRQEGPYWAGGWRASPGRGSPLRRPPGVQATIGAGGVMT